MVEKDKYSITMATTHDALWVYNKKHEEPEKNIKKIRPLSYYFIN